MTPLTIEQVRQALRSDLPFVALAAILVVAGFLAAALWRLRSRDPLLLWLAVFAGGYGVRLFLENDLARIALDLDAVRQRQVVAVLTYCLPIPYALFSRELLGRGWKNSITVWLWAQIAFAPLAVAAGVIAGQAQVVQLANNILILSSAVLLLVNLYLSDRPQTAGPALKSAVVVFLVVVLLNNLGLRRGGHVEAVGFLVLLAGLAYAAATRAIAREQKLIAVEQELETARRIQASILPRQVPDIEGLRLAARYEPMAAVAGDFYDFLPVDDRRLTILIADVSGHGVPAALIASMLKTAFRAQAGNAFSPAHVLSGLNAALAGGAEGQFVTAACAFIDLEAQTVTYSAAGHPPALLIRKDEVIELAENGLFLGPFHHAAYTDLAVPFQPGDRLLLYTDGISEATPPDGEPLGTEGLKTLLRKFEDLDVPALADRLVQYATRAKLEDDLTVVAADFR